MKLIIGLGNPGKEYKDTRHNAGFACVELFAERLGFEPRKLQKKFFSEVAEGLHNGEKIIIAEPQTFMNESGKAVAALLNFYHCLPQDLWVVYDDVDLQLGEIRLRPEGSPGTHNGMKSIVATLGLQNFPRLRIGIESRGASAPKSQDISSFVLHPFTNTEMPVFKEAVGKGADALVLALEKGLPEAMQAFN